MTALDETQALAARAHGAKIAAAALRWLAACAIGFAGLLALSLALALHERAPVESQPAAPAAAYLDFDLGVLRAIAERDLAGASDDEHRALLSLWSSRPDWIAAAAPAESARLASLRDAWTAATSQKSRFRTAVRGAIDALPFLVIGLALALGAAALAGALAQASRRRDAIAAGALLLVALPLVKLFDPRVFYDRTASLGLGASAALFVAAFAGTLPGAAARALFAADPPAQHLGALARRPALVIAARAAALDASSWLLPLVPALAAAAVFVCAKADQDPSVVAGKSGLGTLIRAAMREPAAADRIASCALVAGALALLWWIGHRFVLEARSALRSAGGPR
jgi:hypothetical protein